MARLNNLSNFDVDGWEAPEVGANIPIGDVPGDKVKIWDSHITKANAIFPELLKLLKSMALEGKERAVISVSGGSGVGKSGVAAVVAFYLNSIGIGTYTMSGDNYPRRIPMYNDAERLRIFRESGLNKMIADGAYTKEHFDIVHDLQKKGMDADKENIKQYPWFDSYLEGGIEGLRGYLGTSNEQEFEKVEQIISDFKNGEDKIWLKRMGRTDTELWYDEVDFSETGILIIEWTHGNSDFFSGVDIPVLLNSTPTETLQYRIARNRDGEADSPFVTRVLEIEQRKLHEQAHKAKIILSKAGELLSFEQYTKIMENEDI